MASGARRYLGCRDLEKGLEQAEALFETGWRCQLEERRGVD